MHILMSERDFFETIQIVVGNGQESGQEKEIKNVPKRRLCDVSEFFATACSDRWKSGLDRGVKLEDEDPKLFSIFLAWAFDGNTTSSSKIMVEMKKVGWKTPFPVGRLLSTWTDAPRA